MDTRSTLRELCEAFNAHDLDRIMGFFAEDCVLEMPRGDKPWGSRSEGKAAVRAALAARFEGLPDVHYGGDEHFADEVANTGMSKWLLTGHRARRDEEGSAGLRLLYVSRRHGDPEGLLLEDRRVNPAPASLSPRACDRER